MTTPIATLADLKTFAGITGNNTDAVLTMLLTSSLAAIGAFCNRDFTSAQRTEYRDGNDATKMQTVGYPITAFSSLTIDGRIIPASVNGGSGYIFVPNGRMLILKGYSFTQGDRNVVMNYTAGFGDAGGLAPWPEDLKMALLMYVTTRFKERDRLGIGSKSLAGESITFTDGPSGTSSSSGGIPSAARDVLFNYLNTVPESGQ